MSGEGERAAVAGPSRMDLSCVDFHLAGSEGHFWFLARRRFLQSRLAGVLRPSDVLVDVGCGSGAELDWLRERVELAAGIEPDPALSRSAAGKGHRVVACQFPADIGLTPTVITMFDVLEHIGDDAAAVRAAYGQLAGGGRLVITVPAHPRLWSEHDALNRHHRRYTKPGLRRLLLAAGFRLRAVEWFGAGALVAAVALRAVGKDQGRLSDRAGPWLAAIAGRVYAIERGLRVPFGLSLFAIAQKPGPSTRDGAAIEPSAPAGGR